MILSLALALTMTYTRQIMTRPIFGFGKNVPDLQADSDDRGRIYVRYI